MKHLVAASRSCNRLGLLWFEVSTWSGYCLACCS